MSAHEALSETREINETIPQRIIGIEPEQHRFKKGTIWSTQGDQLWKEKEEEEWTPQNNHYGLTEIILQSTVYMWVYC